MPPRRGIEPPVSRVTGGDTHHYTNGERLIQWHTFMSVHISQLAKTVPRTAFDDCCVCSFVNIKIRLIKRY